MSISKAWGPVGVSAVLILVACSGGEVSDTSASTTALSTTTAPSSTTTTAPTVSTSTTTKSTSPGFEPARLPFAADLVIASDQGIVLAASDGAAARLWDDPTALAFLVNDDLVVAQGTTVSDYYPRSPEGPIIVFDSTGSRSLPMDDERLVLFDADVVDGRPVALSTSRTGTGPDDTDERLVVIDLSSGERTDLGSVGAWESGVAQARFADPWVVLLTGNEAQQGVVVKSLTGTEAWSLDLALDSFLTMSLKDNEVTLLRPGFTDPNFTPTITMNRYRLDDGSNLGTTTLTLQPADGVQIDGGFCFTAEWVEETLICDQTYGGPLRINSSGSVNLLGDYDQGVATLPRVRQ